MNLSIKDTQCLKGIALLLLLCHHSWYEGQGYSDIIIYGKSLFMEIGIFCKICVTLFVFLSGYGLTMGCMNKDKICNVFSFYKKRYIKLMINYWVIYFFFVPIGVVLFNRTFPIVYGENFIVRGFVDFMGFYRAVYDTSFGYNATWWFYSCIIVLYLLFPLLYRVRELWYLLIPLCIVFSLLPIHVPIIGTSGCKQYILAFVCGMSFVYLQPKCMGGGKTSKMILIISSALVCRCRWYFENPILWDVSITLNLVVLYVTIGLPKFINKFFSFLGYHSWNIFLFHTFIYYYYFHDVIYWSGNPILIVLTLLAVCIPLSLAIEWLKETLGIKRLHFLLNK